MIHNKNTILSAFHSDNAVNDASNYKKWRKTFHIINCILRFNPIIFQTTDLYMLIYKNVFQRKPVNIKFGIDVNSQRLHLGHFSILYKLKLMLSLIEHSTITIVLGTFTTTIGDINRQLKHKINRQIALQNALLIKFFLQSYFRRYATRVKCVYNHEWCDKINILQFIKFAENIKIYDVLSKLQNVHGIKVSNFIYPIIQGYDSCHLRNDIEIAGTDQTTNVLTGRQMMKISKMTPQIAIMFPLLNVSIDSKTTKMSKSKNNCLTLINQSDKIKSFVFNCPAYKTIELTKLLFPLTEFSEHNMIATKRQLFRLIMSEIRFAINDKRKRVEISLTVHATINLLHVFHCITMYSKTNIKRMFKHNLVTVNDEIHNQFTYVVSTRNDRHTLCTKIQTLSVFIQLKVSNDNHIYKTHQNVYL